MSNSTLPEVVTKSPSPGSIAREMKKSLFDLSNRYASNFTRINIARLEALLRHVHMIKHSRERYTQRQKASQNAYNWYVHMCITWNVVWKAKKELWASKDNDNGMFPELQPHIKSSLSRGTWVPRYVYVLLLPIAA